MSSHEFRDDDDSYSKWRDENTDGYVINISRSHRASDARLHRAPCRTLSNTTGEYVKVCADSLSAARQWSDAHVKAPITPCGTCRPDQEAGLRISPRATKKPTSQVRPVRKPEISAPSGGPVEAWADDYVRFERQHRPDWQQALHTEIKTRGGKLAPADGEVLHATFFGEKPGNADIENLALYCFGSFGAAGRSGIRFEHGAGVPQAPSGAEYPYGYRFALVPPKGGFCDWQEGRRLASFDQIDLGEFKGSELAAQTWLALARGFEDGKVTVSSEVTKPDQAFAVKVRIRPPRVHRRVLGNLVKGVIDGLISAFQAHTDSTVLPVVSALLAEYLPATPDEIGRHLIDPRRSVLGAVDRLVYPYQSGAKWNPSDHLCVAGELIRVDPPSERHWEIGGEIVELSPRAPK